MSDNVKIYINSQYNLSIDIILGCLTFLLFFYVFYTYLSCNSCSMVGFFFIFPICFLFIILIRLTFSGTLNLVSFTESNVIIEDIVLSRNCEILILKDEIGIGKKTDVYKAYIFDKNNDKYALISQAIVVVFGNEMVLNGFTSFLKKIFSDFEIEVRFRE